MLGHAVHMESATLTDGTTSVIFSNPVSVGALPAEYLSVTIVGPDLRASRQVYEGWTGGFESLADFLTSLSNDWRGWPDSRVYQSIEHDLIISAKHDGHVELNIVLRESTVPNGWRVEANVQLEAGEQLSRAAVEVSELVRGASTSL